MHSILLADLAALVAQHGPAILYRSESIPNEALAGYWASTRNRFDLWHQAMARYQRALSTGNAVAMRRWWRDHLVLLEEVLVSEILTRVVAALGGEMDLIRAQSEMAPVTDAVHRNHIEARARVQAVMLNGSGCSVPDAVRLNRLRRGVERWIDVLIGRMSVADSIRVQYAVGPERAQCYAEEVRDCGLGATRETANWLMNAALHDMLSRRTGPRAALPRSNRQVADSVLSMLRPELFDGIGTLKSLWLHRVQQEADHGDAWSDQWLRGQSPPESQDASPEATPGARSERWYW